MNPEAGRSRFGLPLLVGLVAVVATVVAAFAGSTSVSDRGATTDIAMVSPTALARGAAGDSFAHGSAALPEVRRPPQITLPDGANVRKKARCVGCGVVESVRRIDRREIASDVCAFAESGHNWIADIPRDAKYGRVATLADAVDGVLARQPGARRMAVTYRYEIVVRFRDGSRHVFEEATPRTLQSGDRLQVIAGANLPTE